MYTTILPYQKLGYFPTIWKQNWSHQNIAGYTLMFDMCSVTTGFTKFVIQ